LEINNKNIIKEILKLNLIIIKILINVFLILF